jgi:hypothetical protein
MCVSSSLPSPLPVILTARICSPFSPPSPVRCCVCASPRSSNHPPSPVLLTTSSSAPRSDLLLHQDASVEAPPSLLPQKRYCDVTGLEVRLSLSLPRSILAHSPSSRRYALHLKYVHFVPFFPDSPHAPSNAPPLFHSPPCRTFPFSHSFPTSTPILPPSSSLFSTAIRPPLTPARHCDLPNPARPTTHRRNTSTRSRRFVTTTRRFTKC